LSRVLPKLREHGIIVNGMHVSFCQPEVESDASHSCDVIDFDREKEALRKKAG
jgi:hypothetical protein